MYKFLLIYIAAISLYRFKICSVASPTTSYLLHKKKLEILKFKFKTFPKSKIQSMMSKYLTYKLIDPYYIMAFGKVTR